MKGCMAIRLTRSPLLAALVLVTFFARALVPTGFMPGPGGLMLCSGFAPSPAAVTQPMGHDMSTMGMSGMDMTGMDMPGMAHQGDHSSRNNGSTDHEGSSLCTFAAAATTMSSGHTAVLSVSVAVEAGSVQLPDQPFVPRGTIVPTRLPRGPPAFA